MKKTWIRKLRKVMKLCSIQALIAMLLCSLAMAAPNYAQLLDRRISIDFQELALEAALQEVSGLAQVKFVYSADHLRGLPRVTMQAQETHLRTILHEMLAPRNIEFRVHEHESVITLRRMGSVSKDQSYTRGTSDVPALLISGTVTDAETTQPMPGVNIVIKGTTTGTTTSNDGVYTINAAPQDILVFSFIGYRTEEVVVENKTTINIALNEDIQSLKEVEVNAGYYTTTKQTQTGSIGTITAAEISNQPVSNPLGTLYGRVAGLEVIQTTGVPGGNFQVRIRGQNSIANGNDPLYIVDGVPYISTSLSFAETSGGIYADGMGINPLNSLNPQDIESIEVLKDADATAIYGSRGANGVILITTKKGVQGKTHVELTYREGAGQSSRQMNLLKTPAYLEMRKEAYANDGLTPDAAGAPDLVVWDQERYTDWQEELVGGTALFRDAQLSVSGGEKNTQFSIGAGYHKETTVFPGDNNDQRLSFHSMISNTSPNGRLKTSATISYALTSTDLPKQDLTYLSLILAPNAPPMLKPDGQLNWGSDAWHGVGLEANPLSYTRSGFESKTGNLIINGVVSYAIIPDLTLKVNTGYTNVVMNAITTTPKSALDPANAAWTENSSVFSGSNFANWLAEPQLNFSRQFGPGKLDVLAGTTFLEQITEGSTQLGVGFSSEALMKNINAADRIDGASSRYSQYRYHAVFGRLNYNLNDQYMLNLTGRRDGSSRFGPGRQFANFGAIGAAWVFSEAAFVGNFPALSFGKLRMSYGVTGNDQIGDYQYLDTYSPAGSGTYMNKTGLSPQRLFNPEFGWESVRKLEAAIELGFFEDRITTTIAAYRNRSSNQLVGTPLPSTTGYTSIQSNFPAVVQNSGLEVQLSTINIVKDQLHWTTSVNATIPKNKLIDFPGLESSQYANRYVVGEPLSISKVLHNTGVNPETGVYQFEDTDGDGAITSEDRQTIRFKGRRFYGAFTSSLQWKGFQFDFMIEYVNQDVPNYLLYFVQTPGRSYNNTPAWVSGRWNSQGDETDIQKFSTGSEAQLAYSNLLRSDASISDGSFIRLKNLALSWTFPSDWISRVDHVSIFLQGQNLALRTSYRGLHPENSLAVLPPLRTLTAGLRLKF